MRYVSAAIVAFGVFFLGIIFASSLAMAIGQDDATRSALGFIFGMPVGVVSAITFSIISEW